MLDLVVGACVLFLRTLFRRYLLYKTLTIRGSITNFSRGVVFGAFLHLTALPSEMKDTLYAGRGNLASLQYMIEKENRALRLPMTGYHGYIALGYVRRFFCLLGMSEQSSGRCRLSKHTPHELD